MVGWAAAKFPGQRRDGVGLAAGERINQQFESLVGQGLVALSVQLRRREEYRFRASQGCALKSPSCALGSLSSSAVESRCGGPKMRQGVVFAVKGIVKRRRPDFSNFGA